MLSVLQVLKYYYEDSKVELYHSFFKIWKIVLVKKSLIVS